METHPIYTVWSQGESFPEVRLTNRRVTTGRTRSGKAFQIVDMWKDPQCAHRELEFDWIGTTAFEERGAGNFIASVSNDNLCTEVQSITSVEKK